MIVSIVVSNLMCAGMARVKSLTLRDARVIELIWENDLRKMRSACCMTS